MSAPRHFSSVADGYARFRPSYPPELFRSLARTAPARRSALDVAAGSGQAALGLVEHFEQVIALDAGLGQLGRARPHARVRYLGAAAEALPLAAASADLLVVAQALHWFRHDVFFAEVRRVLVPGGVVAAWCYQAFGSDDPAIDRVVRQFEMQVVGAYWPPERRLLDDGYRTIPFPFESIVLPSPDLELDWTRREVLGYLGTWSAVARCRAETGRDPLPWVENELAQAWSDDEPRHFRWPLALRAGRA